MANVGDMADIGGHTYLLSECVFVFGVHVHLYLLHVVLHYDFLVSVILYVARMRKHLLLLDSGVVGVVGHVWDLMGYLCANRIQID